jgi:hypothetical protein
MGVGIKCSDRFGGSRVSEKLAYVMLLVVDGGQRLKAGAFAMFF